ncbi:hypothetical protein BDZ97DRAFT_1923669 [Flammula alnicola]|nr:hypothetical protein BDZ97DRAFT_1923669 [Flammula alnicola]
MSSFDFIPRSIKKKKIDVGNPPPVAPTSTLTGDQVSHKLASTSTSAGAQFASESFDPQSSDPGKLRGKGKQVEGHASVEPTLRVSTSAKSTAKPAQSLKTPDLDDLAGLVCLALSDYAIWADADLRRKIDWSSDMQEDGDGQHDDGTDLSRDDHGYIPLAYLFRHSSVFLQASSSPSFAHQPETTYVKALRTYAAQFIDVRLVLSSEGSSRTTAGQWSKKSSTQTGYEVRRKTHAKTESNNLSQFGKADWDKLTIYVENIPIQYRSLTGVVKFVTALLSASSREPSYLTYNMLPFRHIIEINPAPYLHVKVLLSLHSPVQMTHVGARSSDSGAQRSPQIRVPYSEQGTLGELKAEYLLFRQQLVDEINEFQETEQASRRQVKEGGTSRQRQERLDQGNIGRQQPADTPSDVTAGGLPQIHAGSAYPSGCLVFVRKVHPETNKTTLRTLFSQAWKKSGDEGQSMRATGQDGDGVDYIDYTKGMDTARRLTSCLSKINSDDYLDSVIHVCAHHPTRNTQTSGLDGIGTRLLMPSDSFSSAITPELVLGKREEVYWEKVPEKVRRQAVDKALKLVGGSTETGVKRTQVNQAHDDVHGRQRKRRRKD